MCTFQHLKRNSFWQKFYLPSPARKTGRKNILFFVSLDIWHWFKSHLLVQMQCFSPFYVVSAYVIYLKAAIITTLQVRKIYYSPFNIKINVSIECSTNASTWEWFLALGYFHWNQSSLINFPVLLSFGSSLGCVQRRNYQLFTLHPRILWRIALNATCLHTHEEYICNPPIWNHKHIGDVSCHDCCRFNRLWQY